MPQQPTGRQLVRYDPLTGEVVDPRPAPELPEGAVLIDHPSGARVLVSCGWGSVLVVQAVDGQLVQAVELGERGEVGPPAPGARPRAALPGRVGLALAVVVLVGSLLAGAPWWAALVFAGCVLGAPAALDGL